MRILWRRKVRRLVFWMWELVMMMEWRWSGGRGEWIVVVGWMIGY